MATAESYFRTRVTRPFRWAIPLAIAGYVLLILLPLLGAVVSHSSCVPSTTIVQQTQTHMVIQRQVMNRGCLSSSPTILLTGVAMPLFVLCQLPALFFFIRGLLWAANSLYDLRQRADAP